MPMVTNYTTQTLDFVVPGTAQNGVPPTESLAPGETRNISVDENDATYRGRIIAGAIGVAPGKMAKALSEK